MQALITCGLACRADSTSLADFASPKLNAAVLFEPTIFAKALRSSVFAVRNVDRSYNVNTTDATKRATAEVTMTIVCNLCRIDKSRYQLISASLRAPFVRHDLF